MGHPKKITIPLPFYDRNVYLYRLGAFLSGLGKFKSLISKELCRNPCRTLDICCGMGNFADLVNGEYLGIDLNQKYVLYAGNRFKEDKLKKFIISNITDIKFRTDYYDNVLVISALHHLSDKAASEILERINKAAKRRIIITDPAIETGNLISRFFILLDRGKFIRTLTGQLDLISKYLNVESHFTFYAGLAHARMIICKPKR